MANASNFVTSAETELKLIMNLIYEAENRAGDLLKKYERLGSNSFTNQHFTMEDPDNPGQYIDKPWNYTKDEFSNAISNLRHLSGLTENCENSTDNIKLSDVLVTIVKITG